MTRARAGRGAAVVVAIGVVAVVVVAVAVLAAAVLAVGSRGGGGPPAHAAPDGPIVGPQGDVPQFVARCGVSHHAFDDPIVHPGHPGASHQHVFFGNTAVTATARHDELLGAPTTCDQRLDTASYWAPVLLDGAGHRVPALGAVAYYRPGPGVDPTTLVPYPPDLRLVAGDASASEPQPLSVVAWSCGVSAVRSVEPVACPASSTLRLLVTFPDCWDGERLWVDRPGDPADRHAVYSSGGECPASHPVPIPQLQLAVDHAPVDPLIDPMLIDPMLIDPAEVDQQGALTLSSGSILSGHADFWNAWDQDKLVREVESCLHRGIVCDVTATRRPAST